MRMLPIAALLLCAFPFGIAQDARPLASASAVMCDVPSRSENLSPWTSSHAGFSGAVEVRASISGSGNHRRCLTSWVLHVKGEDRKERILKVDEREDRPAANEWTQENSFEMNAWSKDGRLLLASQIEAQGDWDETTPVIFDFASNHLWRVELYSLFKRMIPAGCDLVYRAVGFAADGSVHIDAYPTEDDRSTGEKPCFSTSRWRLDFRKNTITR
jgi:hypothetical protein